MSISDEHCPASPTVLMDNEALEGFLAVAIDEYRLITPESPIPCFALAIGIIDARAIHVRRLAFGNNARRSDPAARREFAESIVPRFGPAYENESRGWWMDSRDLLKASREAEAEGLEIIGSIHMHPDWHRLGPPCERGVVLSERPTPMDRYVFGRTAWPVNLICYLECRAGVMYYALACWAPPPADRPGDGSAELPLRIRTVAGEAARMEVGV